MKTITAKKAARLLPSLEWDANKYTRGTCELVVGEPTYPGAGVLAAMAASKAGAGYVCVYTCAETAAALRVAQPSCVCWPIDSFNECFHPTGSRHPRAVAVGCGFAGLEASTATVLEVLSHAYEPVLVDGGGLAALATPAGKEALRKRFEKGLATVIAPHGGEAERIIDSFGAELAGERRAKAELRSVPAAASDALFLARALGVVCVLKGPNTYIADGNEECADEVIELACGTPALAKAGTGDVLAGIVASLLAQGMDPKDACILGTYVHAQAGVLAAAESSQLCVCAEDVIAYVPSAIRALEKKSLK